MIKTKPSSALDPQGASCANEEPRAAAAYPSALAAAPTAAPRPTSAAGPAFAMVLAAALMLAALLALFPGRAFAYTTIDTSATVTATVSYTAEGAGIGGVEFRLYKVADVSSDVEFTVTGEFAKAGVDVLDGSRYDESAQALAVVVSQKDASGNARYAPAASATTNAAGNAAFAALGPGMYLLVGDVATVGSTVYTPGASLVTLPLLNPDDTWNYEPAIEPKKSSEPVPTEPVSRSVVIVWDDPGLESERPDAVEVVLLRDGVEYDRVTLGAGDSWRHEWTGLDPDSTWAVYEVVPDGYTASSVEEGTVTTITNKRRATTPPTPSASTGSSTVANDVSPSSGGGSGTTSARLSQTGDGLGAVFGCIVALACIAGVVAVCVLVKSARGRGRGAGRHGE